MFEGSVVSIYIAEGPGTKMLPVAEVQAVPGKGLAGDRYYNRTGTFSKPQPDRELTLIEGEAVDAFREAAGIDYSYGDARRNIVTRAVPLNHLVGREFQIGTVRVRGLELCEPCGHLARLTDAAVLPGLVHRGGLRAQILNEGLIKVGDAVASSLG